MFGGYYLAGKWVNSEAGKLVCQFVSKLVVAYRCGGGVRNPPGVSIWNEGAVFLSALKLLRWIRHAFKDGSV